MEIDEAEFLATMLRIGLNPCDGTLECEFVYAMLEAQTRFELQQHARSGYWNGIGYASAGSGKWGELERAAFGKDSTSADPEAFSRKTGIPLEKVLAYVAAGGSVGSVRSDRSQ